MTAITQRDVPMIRQWANCQDASVDADGDVWIEGPMVGHWLKPDRLAAYAAWRDATLSTPDPTPDPRLAAAGKLLFGSRWQSDLARALGVGDRRVREWLSGTRRIPVGVWPDIANLLHQRQAECAALASEIDG